MWATTVVYEHLSRHRFVREYMGSGKGPRFEASRAHMLGCHEYVYLTITTQLRSDIMPVEFTCVYTTLLQFFNLYVI